MHLILFSPRFHREFIEAALTTFVVAEGQPAFSVQDFKSVPTTTGSLRALHGARLGDVPEFTVEFPSGTLYREALIQKATLLAASFTWALCSWSFSYSEHITAFVTEDATLADALTAHCVAQEQTRDWKKRKTLDHLILARYDNLTNLEEQLKGAIFFDHGIEGEWAWRRSEIEQNPPYVLLHWLADPSEEQKIAGLRWCQEHGRKTWTDSYGRTNYALLVSCKSRAAFHTLCGTGQDDDPIYGYILSGLANPKAILRQIIDQNELPLKHPEEERERIHHSDLHELVRLGRTAGWAYGWDWGGGAGEYHATFWAHEPLLTYDLWRELETLSETQRGVKPLARF
ncbi:hypothetical protein [Armatimonas sp.]|uniref:hypothetical protein n=1 Tax=Armatimonas sp. TaxID=1872638 RepID=UPI0037500F04